MLDLNKIYCQDCFEFLDEIDNNVADLAIIDPPYGMKKGVWDNFKTYNDYLFFTRKWIDKLIPKIKESGSFYFFNTAYNSAYILQYLNEKKIKVRNWIVWNIPNGLAGFSKKNYSNRHETILFFTKSDNYIFNFDDIRVPYFEGGRKKSNREIEGKIGQYNLLGALCGNDWKDNYISNFDDIRVPYSEGGQKKSNREIKGKIWQYNPLGALCGNVWKFSNESSSCRNTLNGKKQFLPHPCMKNLDLIMRIIKASSNENDLVLDCFAGIGTILVAAKNLHRNFIGCDSNLGYVEIANKYLQTGSYHFK
ncbi:DNA methylase N-4/N-6 [uncultured archaeal virus]|uniref:DNA methylase N-4/N-6 n=1 Tax=uncultured archaeal virus TaxID=1960247 RepID=A0A8B0LP61_9VIRU|nr:DNA methylase N-4/N-6 [uncultured archaeal virus]